MTRPLTVRRGEAHGELGAPVPFAATLEIETAADSGGCRPEGVGRCRRDGRRATGRGSGLFRADKSEESEDIVDDRTLFSLLSAVFWMGDGETSRVEDDRRPKVAATGGVEELKDVPVRNVESDTTGRAAGGVARRTDVATSLTQASAPVPIITAAGVCGEVGERRGSFGGGTGATASRSTQMGPFTSDRNAGSSFSSFSGSTVTTHGSRSMSGGAAGRGFLSSSSFDVRSSTSREDITEGMAVVGMVVGPSWHTKSGADDTPSGMEDVVVSTALGDPTITGTEEVMGAAPNDDDPGATAEREKSGGEVERDVDVAFSVESKRESRVKVGKPRGGEAVVGAAGGGTQRSGASSIFASTCTRNSNIFLGDVERSPTALVRLVVVVGVTREASGAPSGEGRVEAGGRVSWPSRTTPSTGLVGITVGVGTAWVSGVVASFFFSKIEGSTAEAVGWCGTTPSVLGVCNASNSSSVSSSWYSLLSNDANIPKKANDGLAARKGSLQPTFPCGRERRERGWPGLVSVG